MALHTGSAQERDGDYFGPPVNRVARLLGTGHGGQILLSRVTFELARDALPTGASANDLGEHRLKDLIRPEHIFQVSIPESPKDLPPLKTLDLPVHNLPVQPTPLIGRERELAELRHIFLGENVRLVTVIGTGGIGKTRLVLQAGAEFADAFESGVYLVELAPLRDAALVPSTVAQTLGVQEAAGRLVLESIKDFLHDQRLLLLLDNFEQVVAAATVVAELLAHCPNLRILVTSRVALRLRGEHEFPLSPLALPNRDAPPVAEALSQFAAVTLFIQRAIEVKPSFAMTNENAPAVAEICHRLDGLPLALELAAARVRILSPQALVARLEHRLPLLVGGAHDLPLRQQTLRRAIDWSYDLLPDHERALFRRLGVFAGGCTLDAVEAACNLVGDPPQDVLSGLESLVASSLVTQRETDRGEPRFGMLETLREYAIEQLEASGEAEAARRQHASYFRDFAAVAQGQPHILERVARLRPEHDNLRAALSWAAASGDEPTLVRLAAALGEFWWHAGYLSEGNTWIEQALARGEAAPPSQRARLLFWDGRLALRQNDFARAAARYHACLALQRESGDQAGAAVTLQGLGSVILNRDPAQAKPMLEESIALRRLLGITEGLPLTFAMLGVTHLQLDELEEAGVACAEGVRIGRQTKDTYGTALALVVAAIQKLETADPTRSGSLLREALRNVQAIGDRWAIAHVLEILGWVASEAGDPERAARLCGAADTLLASIGLRLWGSMIPQRHEHFLATARTALGEEQFAVAWNAGRALSQEEAIAYGLEADARGRPAATPAPGGRRPSRKLLSQGEAARLRCKMEQLGPEWTGADRRDPA
jgi:predicted ATPase